MSPNHLTSPTEPILETATPSPARSNGAHPEPLDPILAEAKARLERLTELPSLAKARAYVEELRQRYPDHPAVENWWTVLQPPKTRVLRGQADPDVDLKMQLVKIHGPDHPGCWIAVHRTGFLGSDRSLAKLREQVESLGLAGKVLYSRQPTEDGEWI